ncbi:MAG: hypothetical protein E7157_02570 [Lactobacillales bacterium]|nr:hypothetical protein [Lactobacillales bacterium]
MIIVDRKHIKEYIEDTLNSYRIKPKTIEEKLYHHNSSYKDGASIIKNGILSLEQLNNKKIIQLSEEQLKLYDDTSSHVNGADGISLSIVGLTDLYRDEDEYDPFVPDSLDIIVSKEVQARRSSTHYGNEFIAKTKISSKLFESIDVRLLKLIDRIKYDSDTIKLIENYNHLLDIAKTIKLKELDISIREMSGENLTLDIERLSDSPKVFVKI